MQIPPPVVIDCHFFIEAVTLTADQRRNGTRPAAFDLIRAFEFGHFRWNWEEEILREYSNVVSAQIRNHRPGKPTVDKAQALLTINDIRRLGEVAKVTDEFYDRAWDAVMDEARPAEERDEDDVIYLAAAEASCAIALLSNDRSLKNLIQSHRGVRVVSSLSDFLQLVGFKPAPGRAPAR